MSDDLRDAIAQLLCADDNFNWAGESWDVCGEPVQDWWRSKADAVLAMPEIADMLALKRLVNGLTIKQVARALRFSSYIFRQERYDIDGDDEKAISQWREPT